MATVNGVVAHFSGTIAYQNETTGSFHCQAQYDPTRSNYWSFNESHSAVNMGVLDYIPPTFFETVPFINNFSWAAASQYRSNIAIRDTVWHLFLLITMDDGTEYPVSLTYDFGQVRLHSSSQDLLSNAANRNTLYTIIASMIQKANGNDPYVLIS